MPPFHQMKAHQAQLPDIMTSSDYSCSSNTCTEELRRRPVTMYDAEDSDTASDADTDAPPLWDEDMDAPSAAMHYFYGKCYEYVGRTFNKLPLTTIQTRTFHFPVNDWILWHCPHLRVLLTQPPSPTPLLYQKEPISRYRSTSDPGDQTLTIKNESPVLLLCLIYHYYGHFFGWMPEYFSRGNGLVPDPYIDTLFRWGINTTSQLFSLFDLAIRYSYIDLHCRLHSHLIDDLEDEWSEDTFPLYLLNLWRIETFQCTREGVAFRDEVLAIGAQNYETLENHEVFNFFIESMPSEVAAYILWMVRGDSDGIEAWYPGQWWEETVIGETKRDTEIRIELWDQGWDFSAFREVCWDQPVRGLVSTPVDFLAFEDIGAFFEDEGELSPRTLPFPAIPAFSVVVGGGGSGGEESDEEVRQQKSRINPYRRLRTWCSSIRLRRPRSG